MKPWDWTRGEDPPSYPLWCVFFFFHHVFTPTPLSGPPLSSDGYPFPPPIGRGPLPPLFPTIALRLPGFPLQMDQANLQGKSSPAPHPTYDDAHPPCSRHQCPLPCLKVGPGTGLEEPKTGQGQASSPRFQRKRLVSLHIFAENA
jgi:hypothetical protein